MLEEAQGPSLSLTSSIPIAPPIIVFQNYPQKIYDCFMSNKVIPI